MVKIIVPGELPGLNEIVEAAKCGWHSYSQMKKVNTEAVAYCALGKKSVEVSNILVIWHCKNKRKDKDNIAAGMKFILDGLVMARVLPNDTWKYVKMISHEFRIDRKNPRIEIIVEEAGEWNGEKDEERNAQG